MTNSRNNAGRGGIFDGSGGLGAILNVFPLLLIPVLIYNFWAFGASVGAGENPQSVTSQLGAVWFSMPMASGATWTITFGDFMVLLALMFLFIELLKSTSTGTSAIFNHALSMLVFIICLVEFLLHPAFATTGFFFIMIMALLDVLAGVVVTIISARRDVEFAS
jgi:hypothetical protein